MLTSHQVERRERAVAELQHHARSLNSQRSVESLSIGLTQLRDLLVVRVHDDVARKYGTDSMCSTSPANMDKMVRCARTEIEAYLCIVVDDEVTQKGYVNNTEKWFLDWIFCLRLGENCRSVIDKRVDFYRSRTIEQRRLKFLSVLQHSIPESTKAPLILFRLFPRSVRIVAAVAFGDLQRAKELRVEQSSFLPAIRDCHECHGRVLDNDEICMCCGNPVWTFSWLLSD